MDEELWQIAVEFGATLTEECMSERAAKAYSVLKKLQHNPIKLLQYIESISSIEEFDQYLDEE